MPDRAALAFPRSRLRAARRSAEVGIQHDLPALGSAASHHVDVRVHGAISLAIGALATIVGPVADVHHVGFIVVVGLLTCVVGVVHLLVEPSRISQRALMVGHLLAVIGVVTCAAASGHGMDLSAGPILIVIAIINAACFRTSRETWRLLIWSLAWYGGVLAFTISAARTTGAVCLLAATLLPIAITLTWLRGRIDLLVAELRRLADHDVLTGLLNREGLRRRAADVSSTAAAAGDGHDGLALMLLDVDRFKVLNDTNGHPAGDAALAWLGDQLRASVREPAIVARYGGEEFIVLLPVDSVTTAAARAEEIRRTVESASRSQPSAMTVSIGVSVGRHDEQFADLYVRADLALYAAKHNGRNRIEMQTVERVHAA
ncbi:diguanylate cyclase [uncultured Jatrophihabitans sp.]|uniref:GGDEF domain-containing protein n=1 Tax=uncultured Jatrophihabitans sp. TaxID=1610747 RepID=UPI0035CABB5F